LLPHTFARFDARKPPLSVPRDVPRPAPSILFICTGNIFRSMTAEYVLKALLGPASPYAVASAGTEARPQQVHPAVQARLHTYGIDPSAHRQRRLTATLLDAADVPVAMGLDHRDHVRSRFGRDVPLFNQYCCGEETPVRDVWEVVPDLSDRAAVDAYVCSVVDYLYAAMPAFLESVAGGRPYGIDARRDAS
jgi:protein-tyrosine phosphatase